MSKENHKQLAEDNLARLRAETEHLRLQADTALRYSEQVWWSWNLLRKRLKIRAVEDCILGYEGEDLDRGENFWWEKMHPEDLPDIRQSLEACLNGTTSTWRCEHRLKDISGDWVWVEQSGFINRRDADGMPVEMVGTTRKIQERQQLVELFQGSEALLHAITENAPVHFWVRDQEGIILLCSRSLRQLLQIRDAHPETASFTGEESYARWQGRFHEALRGEQVEAQITLKALDGSEKRFRHQLVPVTPLDARQAFAVLELFTPVGN